MDAINRTDMRSIVRTAIVLLLLFLLLFALYSVMSAFLGVFTFAIIFSVSFHGVFEKYRHLAGKFKKLPAIIYGVLMVSLIAVPFIFLLNKLGDVIRHAMDLFGQIKNGQVPALPGFIKNIPVLGDRAATLWSQLEKDPVGTIGVYDEQIKSALQHLISGGTGLMGAGLELILGIVVSAILLHYGKKALEPIDAFLSQLLGVNTADSILDASGKAIKGVAIGVMGTGLIAAVASWIGFKIAGIQIAGILAAVTFFLGVVGGMAAWGFTGMFKGAIVLAVFYTIIQSWITKKTQNGEMLPGTLNA